MNRELSSAEEPKSSIVKILRIREPKIDAVFEPPQNRSIRKNNKN